MSAYYNEIEPYAAQWLRNLIAANLIAPGEVDTRSITEVQPDDVKSYTQCHFFAGIGGWSLAARLAGWPDERPMWTGSCPCQPFSVAGKRRGAGDARHLWPELARLITDRKPASVFGEQVASADGKIWLSGVRTDLEVLGYAVGATDLCAAGVGAPHIRQRLWWVAHSERSPRGSRPEHRTDDLNEVEIGPEGPGGPGECRAIGGLADASESGVRNQGRESNAGEARGPEEIGQERKRIWDESRDGRDGVSIGMADSERPRLEVRTGEPADSGQEQPAVERDRDVSGLGHTASNNEQRAWKSRASSGRDGATGRSGAWSDTEFIPCLDGKARRVESRTFPLAHGVPARVGKLRAYGNAIVPQVAAEFIAAYLEATS